MGVRAHGPPQPLAGKHAARRPGLPLAQAPPPRHRSPLRRVFQSGALPPRVVCLRQSPTHIYYTAVYPPGSAPEPDRSNHFTRQWLEDYFQLVRYPDLETLYLDWRRRDPELFGKVHVNDRATGVRVLRQDPWECLLAYVADVSFLR